MPINKLGKVVQGVMSHTMWHTRTYAPTGILLVDGDEDAEQAQEDARTTGEQSQAEDPDMTDDEDSGASTVRTQSGI